MTTITRTFLRKLVAKRLVKVKRRIAASQLARPVIQGAVEKYRNTFARPEGLVGAMAARMRASQTSSLVSSDE